MTELRQKRRSAQRRRCIAAALVLMIGSESRAGTITCSDQVGALRAKLAGHPNKAVREQLDDAERLCREGKNAEALDLAARARAAIAAKETGAVPSTGSAIQK